LTKSADALYHPAQSAGTTFRPGQRRSLDIQEGRGRDSTLAVAREASHNSNRGNTFAAFLPPGGPAPPTDPPARGTTRTVPAQRARGACCGVAMSPPAGRPRRPPRPSRQPPCCRGPRDPPAGVGGEPRDRVDRWRLASHVPFRTLREHCPVWGPPLMGGHPAGVDSPCDRAPRSEASAPSAAGGPPVCGFARGETNRGRRRAARAPCPGVVRRRPATWACPGGS